VRKGNLEQNTNEYSLLLWQTANVFRSPDPETVLTMSSSSNRTAIGDISWLDDNETLAFLGENPGELHQLYTFSIRTRVLEKVTNHPSNVISYGMTGRGDVAAYVAEEPLGTVFDERSRRQGVIVSSQNLRDLIADQKGGETWSSETQLFLQSRGTRTQRIQLLEKIEAGGLDRPLFSPDGKYVVVRSDVPVADIPAVWKEYANPLLQHWISQGQSTGESWLERYDLIDTATGKSRILLDAPNGPYGSEVAWSTDGSSVAIAGTYLPLDKSYGAERKMRQSTIFVIEMKIFSGEVNKISEEDLKILRWDWKTNCLILATGRTSLESNPPRVSFCKKEQRWEKVTAKGSDAALPEIVVEEGMNNPPSILAVDSRSQRRTVLLDMNPQFRDLSFGREEEIKWKGSDGHEVRGGLYYPPDYVPGKRYPLVIQTHGFISDKFWIDGPWTTAFAAQPLAGKEIIVLQADESTVDIDTPMEVDREVASFEGAIDYLDEKGLIDRNRVGLIGHSRTCLYVMYMLTHSKYHIAAASITDGLDAGYFQYIAFLNSDVNGTWAIREINGAAPFGDGLATWVNRSPGFRLSKVQTPLRIMALNGSSLLAEWECFAGLSHLGRPVEMTFIKDGSHILERPWDRMVSQQGNVDWFTFWLKDEEDPDPTKAEQYKRWRELRKLQPQDSTKPQASSTPVN
jgi:dipeptidyl aminopeptidase/acylaminoacyl peptidase